MPASAAARRDLVALLRLVLPALAAYIAYHGHERSVRSVREKAEIRRIGRQELHHRKIVRGMLAALGAAPSAWAELEYTWIGRAIWLSCFLGGWFLPMYGAARLERGNVGEYVTAARLAVAAGRADFVDACLTMAEVEWDHECYFHAKARSHWMMRMFPDWVDPPARGSYREEFAETVAEVLA